TKRSFCGNLLVMPLPIAGNPPQEDIT
ncbi:hypothetical protein A2U01_0103661, partial [Trifolium medium]|nr:hypothetical protein [Trifolium medium]